MGWITVTSDFTQMKKAIKKMNDGLPKVKELTKKDFKSRVPAQVRKGVKAHYQNAKDIGAAHPSWSDSGEMSGELKYKTAPIGVDHFNMSPKKDKGRQKKRVHISDNTPPVRIPKPYTISYMIKKGKRATLPQEGGYFIWRGLAFKRSSNKPKPVEKINTLSVSAMIVNDAKDEIEKNIQETMDKRLANHIKSKMGLE